MIIMHDLTYFSTPTSDPPPPPVKMYGAVQMKFLLRHIPMTP